MALTWEEMFQLPEHLQGLEPADLLGELPYEWLPQTRTTIAESVLFSDETELEDTYRQMQDTCLYPPDVADKLIGLATFSTPAIETAMLDMTEADPRDLFEKNVLRLDPAEKTTMRSRVTNAGFTRSGLYPAENMAQALHTNPERLKAFLARFAGQTAVLAQTGTYFTQLVDGSEPNHIRVGDTWKLSQFGMDLTRYVLNSFMSDHPKYQ